MSHPTPHQHGSTVLVSRPQTGETLTVSARSGERLSLDFAQTEAAMTRQGDSLVFSLENGGIVRVPHYFTTEGLELPALVWPDGTLTALADPVINPDPVPPVETEGDARVAPEGGGSSLEGNKGLDSLMDGVNRLGVLGTLYWGHEQETPLQNTDSSSLLKDGEAMLFPDASSVSYVHASGNVGVLRPVDSGTQPVETQPGYFTEGVDVRNSLALPGQSDEWSVSGFAQQYQSGQGETALGLSYADQSTDSFAQRGFDLEAFVRENTALQTWSKNHSDFGSLEREVVIARDASDARLELAWTMSAGDRDGRADANDITIAVLFRVGADGELIYVAHQTLEFDGVDENGVPQAASGKVSWSVEPGGTYVTSMIVVEAGQNPGTGNTVLTLESLESVYAGEPVWVEPVFQEMPVYTVSASGNVMDDPSHPMAGGAEDTDYHSGGLELSVTRFLLNGEWHEADGETVSWRDEDGAAYRFHLDSTGNYTLEVDGPGAAPQTIDHLNIVYEVGSADGLTAQADLHFRTPDRVFDEYSADQGVIHGSAGNDVIYGGDEGAVIYGGLGSDVMLGGAGTDIFVWRAQDYDGSRDMVKDFSIADNDKLRFEGLLDTPGDLESLLENGHLTLSAQGETVHLGINTDAGAALNVDVTMRGNEFDSYKSAYVQQNGSDDGLELALLQVMLANA